MDIINPDQFIAINKLVIERPIIDFLSLNILINRENFPKKKIPNNKKRNDQIDLWHITSKAGICLISLKSKGWGIPHMIVERNKKKIPLYKKLCFIAC